MRVQEHVLVLNRNWQAIAITGVCQAFCDLFRGVATAIDTGNDLSEFQAVTLKEWLDLPIREAHNNHPADKFIRTIHGPVRIPTVIVKSGYADMPKKRPKLDNRGIRQRDNSRCQITGEICPGGSVDHLVPKSRGGARKSWRNMVWMKRELNFKKGNRTLDEMGWKLIRMPKEPPEVRVNLLIHKRSDKPDWDHFLIN